ncbi:MAG: enoyl-CoA hydratase/isomerase family protein [Bacteroidales bacterium]|nr:MAG: enoyl-CoA hydratase/isomerase family protein [Bacteroidales bacterium]
MYQYDTIEWKVEEKIGHLVLDQPPANSMDNRFFVELKDLVNGTIPGEDLDGILIYGRGRHFSSGAFLDDLFQNVLSYYKPYAGNRKKEVPEFLRDNLETFQSFGKMNVPVISVIRGVCLGAALELTLFCHIRICAEGAVLGLPETSFNLLPGLGGVQNFINLTNPLKTLEVVLGGNSFTPQEALEWNVVDRVTDKKIAFGYAIDFAKFVRGKYSRIRVKELLEEFDENYYLHDSDNG